MEKKHKIITIGREYGSGGHNIGKALAERLGLPCYDNELISIAAKDSGFKPETFENAEKTATNTFSFALNMVGSGNGYGMPLNNQLFMIQSGIIRTIADQESAIIVGRCADYVLDDYTETIDFFIQAEPEARIQRVMDRNHITYAKAADSIKKMDKYRSTYYNFYTNQKWGDRKRHDLCLNTTHITIEQAVDILETYVRAVWPTFD